MAGNNNRDPRSRRESIQEGVIKQLKEFQTSFTESFEKTFNKFNKDLSDILVQNIKTEREVNKSEQRSQRDILNDLRDSLEREEAQFDENLKDNLKELEEQLEEENKKKNELQDKFNQNLKQFLGNLTKLGMTFIRQYGDASDRILSAYNTNLQSITMRMQISNAEYAKMLSTSTKEIKDLNLEKQFSSVDYLGEVTNLLTSGMTEERAQAMALNNLISRKVVPGLEVTNRNYTNLVRLFGTDFQEAVTSIAHYATDKMGTAGLDQSELQTLINNTQTLLLGSAAYYGADQEDMLSQLTLAGDILAEEYGQSVFEQFFSDLHQTVTSGVAPETLMASGVMTSDELAKRIANGEIGQIMEEWLSVQSRWTNDMLTNSALSSALGGNSEVSALIASSDRLGHNVSDFSEKFLSLYQGYNQDAEWQKTLDELADGYYQTATEQTKKQKENNDIVVGISQAFANVSEETLELWSGLGSVVGSGLQTLITAVALKNATGVNPLSSLGTSAGNFLGNIGGRFGLGKVAGGVALGATGLGLGAIASDFATGGIGQAFAGNTSEGFNPGNVAGNAAKWAATGAVLGPWGALIGGVAGGLSNLIVSISKTQKSTEELRKEFISSADSYRTVSQEYDDEIQKNIDIQKALNTVTSNLNTESQEYKDAIQVINEKYPEYINNVGDTSTVTDSQRLMIEALMAEEEKQLALAKEKTQKELSSSIDEMFKSADISSLGYLKSDFGNRLGLEETNWSNLIEGGARYKKFSDSLADLTGEGRIKAVGSYLDELVSAGAISQELRDYQFKELTTSDKVDDLDYLRSAFMNMESTNANLDFNDETAFRDVVDVYGASFDKYNELKSALDTTISYLSTAYFKDIIKGIEENPNYKVSDSDKAAISLYYDKMRSKIGDNQTLKDTYNNKFEELIGKYSSYIDLPKFATGLESVPYDNFPAVLHKNEMVLTEETATKIRNMNDINADISSVINSVNLVSTAIDNQTVQILQALNEIYNVINNMSNTGVSPFGNDSVLNNIGNFARG